LGEVIVSRHHCNNTNDNEWSHCACCGGRIHESGCKSRKVAGKDCPGQEFHTPLEMELVGYGKAMPEHWQEFQKTL